MVQEVRDTTTNENDTIVMAAKTIGRGAKRDVFKAIYHGKRRVKTAAEIAKATGLTQKRVTECGKVLDQRGIVRQVDGHPVSYEKVNSYIPLRPRILKATGSRQVLEAIPTKVRPHTGSIGTGKFPKFVTVRIRTSGANAKAITIDDIDNFSRVSSVKPDGSLPSTVSEDEFKTGVQAVIGQAGEFKDWGGENSDLFSSHVRINGKRLATAFAFKGPGLRAKLVPGKMGKNGDQIQRMFQQDARVFLVQHWREIDPSVLSEMRAHAINKSTQNGCATIYYGIISGQDSERLRKAYPKKFGI
jgi:hypothetical protein